MTETPSAFRSSAQSYFRSPYAPRIHFDEGGAGGAAGGASGAASGAAGGAATPWFTGIDAETLGHWDNKGWAYKDDPKALATELTKAWKGLERHFGAPADRIVRLPEKADDEAGWSAVRQKLGAPKEAKEYDFSSVKFADGTELDQGFSDTMRSVLHKAGTPKDAATDVVKSVVKFMEGADAADVAARSAKLQADQAALRQEWGTNFDFNRLTAMQGVKRAIGGDDAAAQNVVNAMQEAIGYKATMEFWRKIGGGTTESTFHEGGTTGNPVTMQGAIARKAELQNDPEWTKRYLDGGAKEKAEMANLIQIIAGAAA